MHTAHHVHQASTMRHRRGTPQGNLHIQATRASIGSFVTWKLNEAVVATLWELLFERIAPKIEHALQCLKTTDPQTSSNVYFLLRCEQSTSSAAAPPRRFISIRCWRQ